MVWMTSSLILKLGKIKILPRYISDHCPIEFTINKTRRNFNWRLNGNLIKSEEDIIKNKKILREYFELNNTTDVPLQIIWDASKAYMRGHFIQQSALKNKLKNETKNKIYENITSNETKLKQDPNNEKIKRDLEALKKQMSFIDLEETAKKLKFLKQREFQNANKPGKWLAWKINKKKQDRTIMEIISGENSYTSEEEIAAEFNKFYSKLYSKDQIRKDKIGEFLSKQNLVKLSERQREFLNKEITEKEILKVINNMECNKAPGPDGLNGLYYKTFAEEVIPFLKKIMNDVMENKEVPDSWRYATVTVIPKEGQDPKNVKSYRPISLLNSDYKIFTNILAERMKIFLMEWIGEEQTGFLPQRQMRDNVREIINIIEHYECIKKEELALLTIDMEKAFDNLNWDFFKLLIKELDMGYKFTNAINQIYNKQEAKVKTNSLESQYFKIQKGTRQGCPLSPLLFIFSIEILLNTIRNDPQLKGTNIRKYNYKIRAFADDLICIIEDPIKTINLWMSKFKDFEGITGLKINTDKTMILTKNMTDSRQKELTEKTGIQTRKKIKYLGIYLTAKNSQLLENNYDNKWKEIKKDLEKWKQLKLSLLGRVSAIKMTILPKMTFLFQNIPIIRSTQRFKNWNKDLSKFIWMGKKPRIKRTYLTDEKKRGGLGLPNLQLYHDACGLSWIRDWATLQKTKIITLEGADLRSGWHAYLWYNKKLIEKNFGNHFIRSSLLKIWDKYKRRLHSKTPLWISPLEAHQRKELGRENWPRYKDILIKVNNIYKVKSQEELNNQFTNIGWFQYNQIKEYYNKDNNLGFEDKEGYWDMIMKSERKTISKLYKKLLEWDTETHQVKDCMSMWAKNFGKPIQLVDWEKSWNTRLKFTYATDLKENWVKMFYRWYWTPQKIAKFNKRASNKCWKCGIEVGTFYHCWWTCKKVKTYWKEIHWRIQKMLQIRIDLNPKYFLLGMLDIDKDRNKEILFNYLSTAARMNLARFWKEKEMPGIKGWINKVWEIMSMDKLTYLLRNNHGKPMKQTNWEMVKSYLREEKYNVMI
uniref:Reverse transcriptase domain-containing protein n=1 Tax=Anolis carolinensis TaxID=28377 RepID=A0A803TCQ4_ANOCA